MVITDGPLATHEKKTDDCTNAQHTNHFKILWIKCCNVLSESLSALQLSDICLSISASQDKQHQIKIQPHRQHPTIHNRMITMRYYLLLLGWACSFWMCIIQFPEIKFCRTTWRSLSSRYSQQSRQFLSISLEYKETAFVHQWISMHSATEQHHSRMCGQW